MFRRAGDPLEELGQTVDLDTRERLRQQDRRYSLRQVAQRIDIEPAYLSKTERGEVALPARSPAAPTSAGTIPRLTIWKKARILWCGAAGLEVGTEPVDFTIVRPGESLIADEAGAPPSAAQ